MREGGGTLWNTSKRGRTKNERGKSKILKRGWVNVGQGVDVLKKGRDGNPFMNYGWIGVRKVADENFGITQKPLYILPSNLVR